MSSVPYLPFHNLAYCPKQIIEFIQQPNIEIQDLNNIIENLKMPKNHIKALQRMQIIVSRQEQYLAEENANLRTCCEDDQLSPKVILGKLSY